VQSEWEKVKATLDQHKKNSKHIFCAHIHGYDEYSLDDPVTITAGGGAAMIYELKKREQRFYHAVVINLLEDGSLAKEVITIQ